MVVFDIYATGAAEAQDKAFFAFERRDPNRRGVYFYEFDKSSTQLTDDNVVFNNATKIIDGSTYGNRDLGNIYVYSNFSGSKVSVSITTVPEGNPAKLYMLTGQIINNAFVACDPGGNLKEINTDAIMFMFGFYYNDGTKNKIITYFDSSNSEGIGELEDH